MANKNVKQLQRSENQAKSDKKQHYLNVNTCKENEIIPHLKLQKFQVPADTYHRLAYT